MSRLLYLLSYTAKYGSRGDIPAAMGSAARQYSALRWARPVERGGPGKEEGAFRYPETENQVSAVACEAQRSECWQLRNWPKKLRMEADSASSLSR